MAVRWARRASLECLRTKAEVKANAMKRIKVTAAKPWLETGSRSPEALVCLGRCPQECRNPCLKAQCFVRSIQPLFSFFQRLGPSWRMTGVGKACLGSEVNPSHPKSVEGEDSPPWVSRFRSALTGWKWRCAEQCS